MWCYNNNYEMIFCTEIRISFEQVPSFVILNTGGSAVVSWGNKERTLSTSNLNRQSLSSERAGDVGVASGEPSTSGDGRTGSCRGGTVGTVSSKVRSVATKQIQFDRREKRYNYLCILGLTSWITTFTNKTLATVALAVRSGQLSPKNYKKFKKIVILHNDQ